VTATGSPEAPAFAALPDPAIVPDLLGLPLADAEHLARQSRMSLHVERVAGQPVGRVLNQDPAPGDPRAVGGFVKVVVTAGGDFEAAVPPAPSVELDRIAVPDLLDKTGPQGERILEDMGLVPVREESRTGPPGRIGNQDPPAGRIVKKGSRVRFWVAPTLRPLEPAAPAPSPGQEPPSPAPAPAPPPAPAPAPEPSSGAGLPAPALVSPAAGTVVGAERKVVVGFMWRPVPGADAYLVEVEELGPDGWIENARTTARTSAAVIEVERLSPSAGPLRWRVSAVARGRRGPAAEWIVLR
jgi:hypothetical protein